MARQQASPVHIKRPRPTGDAQPAAQEEAGAAPGPGQQARDEAGVASHPGRCQRAGVDVIGPVGLPRPRPLLLLWAGIDGPWRATLMMRRPHEAPARGASAGPWLALLSSQPSPGQAGPNREPGGPQQGARLGQACMAFGASHECAQLRLQSPLAVTPVCPARLLHDHLDPALRSQVKRAINNLRCRERRPAVWGAGQDDAGLREVRPASAGGRALELDHAGDGLPAGTAEGAHERVQVVVAGGSPPP